MTRTPMCPGCRALLGAGEKVCPYCGWELERTEIRRGGGPVHRLLRSLGGFAPALILANLVFAVVVAVVQVQLLRRHLENPPGAVDLLWDGLLSPHGKIVAILGATIPEAVLREGEIWRLATSVFLHYGAMHIAVNMLSLRNIGGLVEEAYGTGKALALYLLAGLAGTTAGLAAYALKGYLGLGAATYAAAGASGAICGCAGLLAALGFRIGGPQGKALWKSMLWPVGLILVLGIVLSLTGSRFRLDNWGHAGGFLFGLAAGFLCSFGARARSSPAAVKAWDAAAVVLSLLTLAAFVPPLLAVARDLR